MLLEARLLATVSGLAGPVRGAGVVLISLFGAWSVGTALGWSLFAFVVLTAVADFRLPRVALPVAFVRVVVLSVGLDGAAGQWALTVLTTTLITWQWQWPPRVTVPATAALLAVQVVMAGPGVLVRAVLESVLARLAYELLRRSSRRVDRLRELAAAQNRAAAVALDRGRREREYLALLHDTAAATFLMAAHGGEPSSVAAQARRDLVVLAERDDAQGTVDLGAALAAVARDWTVARDGAARDRVVASGGSVAPDGAAVPVEVTNVDGVLARDGAVVLDGALGRGRAATQGEAVASDGAVARGGAVTPGGAVASNEAVASAWAVASDRAAMPGEAVPSDGVAVRGGPVASDGPVARGSAVASDGAVAVRVSVEVVPVPAAVALAFVRAVRELLTNVARHAGGAGAELVVSRTGRGVVVVVRDDGPGFSVDEVPEHRRGLRASVVERVRAAGGAVEIDSAPTRGTTARLVWPADVRPLGGRHRLVRVADV
ncbi:ATP-binding protein [Nocardia sp. NRRL S-836]|uniref:ATP-binding protein n=1 Tax=Nocardia sp. NRRL S-836 TaxID=1519492 RepID=UPI0018D01FB3|nr:ATP-binding protein [Nocardia sp. NRRL S-836]